MPTRDTKGLEYHDPPPEIHAFLPREKNICHNDDKK
jgi:hypothetical protein